MQDESKWATYLSNWLARRESGLPRNETVERAGFETKFDEREASLKIVGIAVFMTKMAGSFDLMRRNTNFDGRREGVEKEPPLGDWPNKVQIV